MRCIYSVDRYFTIEEGKGVVPGVYDRAATPAAGKAVNRAGTVSFKL